MDIKSTKKQKDFNTVAIRPEVLKALREHTDKYGYTMISFIGRAVMAMILEDQKRMGIKL